MIIQKLDIMDVNNSNVNSFNNKIKTMPAVVCFHADWCGHCQQLKPEWDSMVKNLNKNNLGGLLARIEEKKKHIIFICDHASNYMPQNYNYLGLKEKHILSHIYQKHILPQISL